MASREDIRFTRDDNWLNEQAVVRDIAEVKDSNIAIDATYFLGHLLDNPVINEPLLAALSGLTGIKLHINQSLDAFKELNITPLFIFDGQAMNGQDDEFLRQARAAIHNTEEAWTLYSRGKPEEAVAAFGANPGAFRLQNLYPLLQKLLKSRDLHFLVAPYTACMQMGYLDKIDSDLCDAVMGPQELLLYPIHDSILRSFDWENGTVTSISKTRAMSSLSISEPMFIDALLMTGTSFLPRFPPLRDQTLYRGGSSIVDAVNILRTSEKNVANACASFNDMLQAQEPQWLDRYMKARMAVHHYIYTSEEGAVEINAFDNLTKDNYEYLGMKIPEELLGYMNTGLIGPRLLEWFTHSRIAVDPPLYGEATDEYRRLVTTQLAPLREDALSLVLPRLNRAFLHKATHVRVWYDPDYAFSINPRTMQSKALAQSNTWNVKLQDIRQFLPAGFANPVYLEVLALASADFVEKTISRAGPVRGIDDAEMVVSITIWRFLHIRGYVDDSHKLNKWGNALATSLLAVQEATENRKVPGLEEATLFAFELIRFGLLNGTFDESLFGAPRNGTADDKASLGLIGRAATLLKLRHQMIGYTGPLNKSLLSFRALTTAVREADRDLIDSIVASMMLHGQSERTRTDSVDIRQSLPFLDEPHIGLGVTVSTFFDGESVKETKEARTTRLRDFPKTFVPFAEAFTEDLQTVVDFVRALSQGVETLGKELPEADKAAWKKAREYVDARPF